MSHNEPLGVTSCQGTLQTRVINPVLRFMTETLCQGGNLGIQTSRVRRDELYPRYVAWCAVNDTPPETTEGFFRTLTNKYTFCVLEGYDILTGYVYKESSDGELVRLFMRDTFVTAQADRPIVRKSELWLMYLEWCRAWANDPATKEIFFVEMMKLGAHFDKFGSKLWLIGYSFNIANDSTCSSSWQNWVNIRSLNNMRIRHNTPFVMDKYEHRATLEGTHLYGFFWAILDPASPSHEMLAWSIAVCDQGYHGLEICRHSIKCTRMATGCHCGDGSDEESDAVIINVYTVCDRWWVCMKTLYDNYGKWCRLREGTQDSFDAFKRVARELCEVCFTQDNEYVNIHAMTRDFIVDEG